MADGLSTVIGLKNSKLLKFQRGTNLQWQFNMDLNNPYYRKFIEGNCIDKLLKILRKRNFKITTVFIDSYASRRGYIHVDTTVYNALGEYKPRCCFARDNKGVMKLLTVKAQLPVEFVKIGHNAKFQCVVPLILYKSKEESFIGVNI